MRGIGTASGCGYRPLSALASTLPIPHTYWASPDDRADKGISSHAAAGGGRVLNTLEIASRSPLITVIMPAFNHDRYMGEALDSVGAQALEDIELVVVDDGSDTLVEGLVRAKVPAATIIRQTNAGPSAARNAGIARARGRFIAFLDADDVWVATALQRLLKGFKDAPACAACHSVFCPSKEPIDILAASRVLIGQA